MMLIYFLYFVVIWCHKDKSGEVFNSSDVDSSV